MQFCIIFLVAIARQCDRALIPIHVQCKLCSPNRDEVELILLNMIGSDLLPEGQYTISLSFFLPLPLSISLCPSPSCICFFLFVYRFVCIFLILSSHPSFPSLSIFLFRFSFFLFRSLPVISRQIMIFMLVIDLMIPKPHLWHNKPLRIMSMRFAFRMELHHHYITLSLKKKQKKKKNLQLLEKVNLVIHFIPI